MDRGPPKSTTDAFINHLINVQTLNQPVVQDGEKDGPPLTRPPALPELTTTQLPSLKRPSTAPAAESNPPLLPATRPVTSPEAIPEQVLHRDTPLEPWSRMGRRSPSGISSGYTSGSTSDDRSSMHGPSSSLSPPLSILESPQSLPEPAQAPYDWNLFVQAYAAGQWNPAFIPLPPGPTMTAPVPAVRSAHSSPEDSHLRPTLLRRSLTLSSSSGTARQHSWTRTPSSEGSTRASDAESGVLKSDQLQPSPPERPPAFSPTSLSSRRDNAPRLSNDAFIHTHQYDDTVEEPVSFQPLNSPRLDDGPSQVTSPESISYAAATLRWASANVSIRPLAVPSPERELTDPLHSLHKPESSQSRNVTHKGHQMRNWNSLSSSGVVNAKSSEQSSRLLPIPGSPEEAEEKPTASSRVLDRNQIPADLVVKPASAPIVGHSLKGNDSYFPQSPPHPTAVKPRIDESRVDFNRQESEPIPFSNLDCLPSMSSVPVTPFPPSVPPAPGIKHPAEEDFYHQNQWLRAPAPADEADRLRALYRYNLIYSNKDASFDRIAHLAKLVFQCKGVGISLIDTEHQWFKAEAGTNLEQTTRDQSFCSHSILQRSDEPMVVLDTTIDWRFAKNPLVVGGPKLRFYAGAPLRTAEGVNIGSLCLLDDRPWTQFTPRSRHALKEFASIIVREMELWRDKIQLRIRDRIQVSMESFTRECLEIESEGQTVSSTASRSAQGAMERIYFKAAELVKKTLDVEGAYVLDVSRSGLHEFTDTSEGQMSVTLYGDGDSESSFSHELLADDYDEVVMFFAKYPDGVSADNTIPKWFRAIIPREILHALIVPICNIDQKPFALVVAYNTLGVQKTALEGHELSYLRAIGVIILSAVLKRRMILADKAKGLFISNISHELRTPLHGILAAAELLGDTSLNHHQHAFLQTVQACGASLVETVNHVLDYTKLSGNTRAGGVENTIAPSSVDLMQLVEEAVEGCWVGFRARNKGSDEIGNFYSPPDRTTTVGLVETVVNVDLRTEGWLVSCEKGGIRRVLMNLIGNSLKFTSSGYIEVALRCVPPLPTTPSGMIRVEIGVIDTGKGISPEFLRGQLFEPFSQEDPLQTGTGLGLAIVKSIVQSKSIDGNLEVSSTEGSGTDMRVSFDAAVLPDEREELQEDRLGVPPPEHLTIQLLGFNEENKGGTLLKCTIEKYLHSWWGFEVTSGREIDPDADILVLDEDISILEQLHAESDYRRPVVVISSVRGDAHLMHALDVYEKSGGFCRVLFKPGGPSRLRHILKMCVTMVKMRRSRSRPLSRVGGEDTPPPIFHHDTAPVDGLNHFAYHPQLSRRRSEEKRNASPKRPGMTPRSSTYHASTQWEPQLETTDSPENTPPASPGLTVSIGTEGMLLKSSINTLASARTPRVLIVEDNELLRSLLVKWLRSKGYEFREAVDGQKGVDVFQTEGPFDIILIDMSMPVLDGVGATFKIREIEASRRAESAAQRKDAGKDVSDPLPPARILALTGMSALEDKRRAFEAGVDGYLVKPVAFKTLGVLFQQLGVT